MNKYIKAGVVIGLSGILAGCAFNRFDYPRSNACMEPYGGKSEFFAQQKCSTIIAQEKAIVHAKWAAASERMKKARLLREQRAHELAVARASGTSTCRSYVSGNHISTTCR